MDKDFCKGYIAVLKTCTFNNGKKPLSNTTCRIFVNRLAAALTKAVSEGLIDRNPFKLLDAKEKPQKNSSIREFLTIEDVKLGLRFEGAAANSWFPFDDFKIEYLGTKAPTAVEGILTDMAEGIKAIYDLSGRRVSKAVKGIYLINGKKVVK